VQVCRGSGGALGGAQREGKKNLNRNGERMAIIHVTLRERERERERGEKREEREEREKSERERECVWKERKRK
jgi:hypothetical protein